MTVTFVRSPRPEDYDDAGAGDPLERLYKAWFACDGVYFNREHVKYLAAKTTPAFYTEHRSRVPYTPLYPTRYLFAGVKA